jgi:hypothetical protein
VRATVEGLIERWRELGDMLGNRTESLRELTESAIARAEGTMQALDRHADGLAGTADRLESRIDGLRDGLREQTRDLQAAVDDAAVRAQSVTETFRIQERALLEAVDEATRKAGEVRDAHLEANRGVFLHTVNRVLDSLGSLGVDMDRVVEGALVHDVVRRYGRGDRMVAVRRLSGRVRDPIAISRVRDLFAEDQEFRALASKYLSEFEKLLAQAGEADPDELLSASLLTADVGKAYLLLSRAVDRHK